MIITYDTRDNYRIIPGSADARVRELAPSTNYGAQSFTSAGYSSTLGNSETWMYFDLSSIPVGSSIHRATLELTEYSTGNSVPTNSQVYVHKTTSSWTEGGITWNNSRGNYNPEPYASTLIGPQVDFGIRQWDITDLVRDSQTANYGLVLKSQYMKYFSTKEEGQKSLQPRLRVEYTLPVDDVPDITFNPSWLDGTVNVGLGIKAPYQEHRYLWSDSPDWPSSGWSAWLTETSPIYSYSETSPKFLHVEARDGAGNTTWRVSRPYIPNSSYGENIIWFDDVQLEEGSRVSAFNLLTNSNFNTIENGGPVGYRFNGGSITMDTVDSEDCRKGQNCIKINSSSGDAFLSLDQQVSLEPNTDYTISFWIKGQGLAKTGDNFSLAKAESGESPHFTYTAEEDEFDWRQIILSFTTEAELGPLDLNLGLLGGKGTVWIDDLALKKGNSLVTASYTSDGNYLQSITDTAGVTTATYNYTQEGLKTGEIESVTNADGNTRSYTYDVLSRVTGVKDTTSNIRQSYGYNSGDNLERISRDYFDYAFTYDALGRMISVQTDKDGEQTTLVTHSYDESTGTLNSSTFGNSQILEYAYDALDRLEGVKYNDSTRYSYSYDARGNIVRVEDSVNDITTWYSYDLTDRLLSFREEAKDKSSSRYVSYEYDKNNNATSLREVIDGAEYRTSFRYNEDNTIKDITINSGASYEYFHDEKGLPNRVITTLNPNMAHNPTFASGLGSWVNVRGMSVEDGGLYGSNVARGIGYSMLRQYHSGLEEGIYTLSTYVKVVNNPVGAGEFTARIYDAEDNILAISEKIFDTAGDWIRITATMDNPGVPAYIAILAGSTSSLYTGEEEVLWDGVKLEEGDTATEFDQKPLYTDYNYNERGLLSSLQHSLETYTYEFDVLGNITKISSGDGTVAEYTYDSMNQLKTESITENGITRTISYGYDSHGNMISRIEGNKETVYTYDLDRLTQIEEKIDGVIVSTQGLTYDNAGNLINDGEYSYTWEMGRQLAGITGVDLATSYKYNENGLRTEKTVNGMTHEYTLLGSSVTREVIRGEQGNILWTIHYSYAGDSSPVSMNVNGTEYYYLKNAQGDITHIVDGDGNEVASYEYDAWGNHLGVSGGEIAELNPYRYRGYRYDGETGLYYLQSRYYNPELGRFINADALISTGQGLFSHSIFVYCNNNPIANFDITGFSSAAVEWFSSMWWLCVVDSVLPIGDAIYFVGGLVAAASDLIVAYPLAIDYSIAAIDQTLGLSDSRGDLLSPDPSGMLTASTAAGTSVAAGIYFAEHTKNARPSTLNRHQKGHARKKKDQGGEKGDARRKSRSGKRRPSGFQVNKW